MLLSTNLRPKSYNQSCIQEPKSTWNVWVKACQINKVWEVGLCHLNQTSKCVCSWCNNKKMKRNPKNALQSSYAFLQQFCKLLKDGSCTAGCVNYAALRWTWTWEPQIEKRHSENCGKEPFREVFHISLPSPFICHFSAVSSADTWGRHQAQHSPMGSVRTSPWCWPWSHSWLPARQSPTLANTSAELFLVWSFFSLSVIQLSFSCHSSNSRQLSFTRLHWKMI